jgi:hypothetical protein
VSSTANSVAKKIGRDQEQFQGRRKDLWTETATVNLWTSLVPPMVYKVQEQYRRGHRDPLTEMATKSGAAMTGVATKSGTAMTGMVTKSGTAMIETTIPAGLSMGLFRASTLRSGC